MEEKEIVVDSNLQKSNSEDEAKETQSLQESGSPEEVVEVLEVVKHSQQKTYQVGNTFAIDFPKIRREFFSLERKRKGKYSEGDFSALCIAINVQLSRDTFATGRNPRKLHIGKAKKIATYVPLELSMKSIIEDGYGYSDGRRRQHREAIEALVKDLDSSELQELDKEGSGRAAYLCKNIGRDIEKYETFTFSLLVNEIFCDYAKGYALFFNDTMKRIAATAHSGENTNIERQLLLLLGRQKNIHSETLTGLADFLDMYDMLKENRGRFIDRIARALDRIKEAGGVINDYNYTSENETFIFFPYTKKKRIATK